MIRFLGLGLIAALFVSANHSSIVSLHETADTCFYTIHVPPDIDVPETPHFDTTIVRTSNCKKQLLKLPSWGTQTDYTLTRVDTVINVHRSVSFYTGQHYGTIDVTDLPPGTYGMGLMACGNGGSFTVRLK